MVKTALLLLLAAAQLLPLSNAQSMGMGMGAGAGALGDVVGVGLPNDGRYMLPPSTAVDAHARSVVLDWNAVVRSLARGVPFGDWAFEDPRPGNASSRFGRFQDPPLPPAAAARAAALVNAAMREALAPLVRPGAVPDAMLGPGWGGVSASDLWDASGAPGAAASFAAHHVLSSLFPHRQQSVFDRQAPGFDAVLARHLSQPAYGLAPAVWAEPAFTGAPVGFTGAQRVGVAAGRLLVQVALEDGTDAFVPPFEFDASAAAAAVPPAGQYRLTGCATSALCAPANDTGVRAADSATVLVTPATAGAAPLVAGAAADWAPAAVGPSYVASGEYAAQLAWVQAYGEANSTLRSDDDTAAAWFWRGGPNTAGVAGMLTSLAGRLLDAAAPSGVSTGDGGDLWAAADALARLSAAIWDATVATSAAKAGARWWRPETAIRAGGTPGWAPELTNPSEPDWPSAHAAVCGAGAAALAVAFGGDVRSFWMASEDLCGLHAAGAGGWDLSTPAGWQFDAATSSGAFNLARGIGVYADDWLSYSLPNRPYSSFSAMAAECAASRRFAGVSFSASTDAGLALGLRLGAWVAQAYPGGNLTARAAAAEAVVTAAYGVQRRVSRGELPLDVV